MMPEGSDDKGRNLNNSIYHPKKKAQHLHHLIFNTRAIIAVLTKSIMIESISIEIFFK